MALNGGDASIALCLSSALRRLRPGSAIEVYDSQPDIAKKYFPEVEWRKQIGSLLGPRLPAIGRLPSPPQIIRQQQRMRIVGSLSRGPTHGRRFRTPNENRRLEDFAGIDAIISTGGTYLVEQYPLMSRFFEFDLAERLGIPVILFTQSLGPFSTGANRRAMRSLLDRAQLVLLRDQRSLNHLEDIGADVSSVHLSADAAFALADERLPFSPPPDPSGRLKIGVSVRPWPIGGPNLVGERLRYRSAIAACLTDLLRTTDCDITFISTCQGIPEYWLDDSAVAVQIAREIPPDVRHRVSVDREFHTPSEFRDKSAHFDLFIATRMHAGILALGAGTPVIPIAYEFKTSELFGQLGLAEYVLDSSTMTEGSLCTTVKRAMRELADIQRILRPVVDRERRSTEESSALLDEALPR